MKVGLSGSRREVHVCFSAVLTGCRGTMTYGILSRKAEGK